MHNVKHACKMKELSHRVSGPAPGVAIHVTSHDFGSRTFVWQGRLVWMRIHTTALLGVTRIGFHSAKRLTSSTIGTTTLMDELCLWQLHRLGVWLPLPTGKCYQRVSREGRKLLHVSPSPTAPLGLPVSTCPWIQSWAEVWELLLLLTVIQSWLGNLTLPAIGSEGWRRLNWGITKTTCLLVGLWGRRNVPHRDSFILEPWVRECWI